jgi:hypothetical protein
MLRRSLTACDAYSTALGVPAAQASLGLSSGGSKGAAPTPRWCTARTGGIVDYAGAHQHLATDLDLDVRPLDPPGQEPSGSTKGIVGLTVPAVFTGTADLWESQTVEGGNSGIASGSRQQMSATNEAAHRSSGGVRLPKMALEGRQPILQANRALGRLQASGAFQGWSCIPGHLPRNEDSSSAAVVFSTRRLASIIPSRVAARTTP